MSTFKINNEEVFFSSDFHFGHKNIIRLSNRPFKTIDEMDDFIINNLNKKIKSNGILFFLGDFLFKGNKKPFAIAKAYRERIKCERIYFIAGNHDKRLKYHPAIGELFAGGRIYDVLEVEINGTLFCLSHYAHLVWNKCHYGSIHLYGHSHGSLFDNPKSRSFDVGVDTSEKLIN